MLIANSPGGNRNRGQSRDSPRSGLVQQDLSRVKIAANGTLIRFWCRSEGRAADRLLVSAGPAVACLARLGA